ncbi:putative porin [Paraburkholderia youngii]
MIKKLLISAPILLSLAETAAAQSAVALYGIVDAGITYRSNERTGNTGTSQGHSNVAVTSGNLSGSRWGLRGKEELGNGLAAIFVLEDGFDITNGTEGQGGRLFGRQAFVGLADKQYGSLTMGRQYTSLDDFVGPVAPVSAIGGFGAHPGDIDDLDQTTRVDNFDQVHQRELCGLYVRRAVRLRRPGRQSQEPEHVERGRQLCARPSTNGRGLGTLG